MTCFVRTNKHTGISRVFSPDTVHFNPVLGKDYEVTSNHFSWFIPCKRNVGLTRFSYSEVFSCFWTHLHLRNLRKDFLLFLLFRLGRNRFIHLLLLFLLLLLLLSIFLHQFYCPSKITQISSTNC